LAIVGQTFRVSFLCWDELALDRQVSVKVLVETQGNDIVVAVVQEERSVVVAFYEPQRV
jgi:hypothetical protein